MPPFYCHGVQVGSLPRHTRSYLRTDRVYTEQPSQAESLSVIVIPLWLAAIPHCLAARLLWPRPRGEIIPVAVVVAVTAKD
jgi:hypothetical protein